MAIHSGIRDDGIKFQIVPSTRKITVPQSHKIIGTVGSHNSEQLTFMCPKIIDGHDVSACSDHYIDWVNANDKDGRYTITDITTDGDNMYFTWAVDSLVTAASGYVRFAVHFEDKDAEGALLYEWGTTECGECQVLSTIRNTSGTVTPIPDGYLKPSGTLPIVANGEHDVAQYETVDVAVPLPMGTTVITSNGIHDVKDYAEAQVIVPNVIPEGYVKPMGRLEITENGEHDVYNYESVEVAVPETKLTNVSITENGTHTAPEGQGYDKVVVNVQPRLQEKEVTDNGAVTPDDGYDGLSKVFVDVSKDAILQQKSVTVTKNGDTFIEPDTNYDALSKVQVTVNVPTNYVDPKLQEKTVRSNGTVYPDDGYDGLSKVIVSIPTEEVFLQKKTVEITANGETIITADSDYDGMSEVLVNVNITPPTYSGGVIVYERTSA